MAIRTEINNRTQATMDAKNLIHKWALVGGATAGALPVGADAAALAAEEIAMTIQVAALFGISLDKSAAHSIMVTVCSNFIGTTLFETLNVGYPFTIPAKITAAVVTIEAVGKAIYTYYANCQ